LFIGKSGAVWPALASRIHGRARRTHYDAGMADPPTAEPLEAIVLEGVRVHNLKAINVRIPLHAMTVVSGVSGSGKSSLAFDTLYAEGQRRYIESFSPYARQFLERLDKPDADRIENLPPAIALRQSSVAPGKRSTVATATELYDYLRLLFAKSGRYIDPATGRELRRDSPQSVATEIDQLPRGRRLLIAFPATALPAAHEPRRATSVDRLLDQIRERGYARLAMDGRLIALHEATAALTLQERGFDEALVIVDRLVVGRTPSERLLESLETAFRDGEGRCILLVEHDASRGSLAPSLSREELAVTGTQAMRLQHLDGTEWARFEFDRRRRDPATGRDLPDPTPALFSFHSPLGACPTCRGFGSVPEMSWEKLVPDPSKSLADGAIVAWTTPAYRHELEELLALADDYDLPTDIPFSELEPRHLELIHNGVPARRFGGLKGFFRWLERKRYKIGVAAFLARFRSYVECPECHGDRLNRDVLTVRVAGRNLAEVCRDSVSACSAFFDTLSADALGTDPAVARAILPEIRGRLETLAHLGLGYLTLNRPTETLSGGEARRVALTAAVGANLVNMLYVLDEPSTGLHPRDRERVIKTLAALRDAPNTVVIVEHDPTFLRAADWVIDLGPGAGRDGGRLLYEGPPAGLATATESQTAQWLYKKSCSHLQAQSSTFQNLQDPGESLILSGCTRHNLKNLSIEFPLNCLCVVSGVSGSGKSTLVTETLYPALCRALKKDCDLEEIDRAAMLLGTDRLDDVILIDQSPIGRTPRSNPATYLGAFDPIRAAFAATPEAKLRNFGPGAFSFNSDRGGRCPHCRGAGVITVDMQFLPDMEVTCPECGGTRFRRDVLDIKLRGRNIAEVLDMTAAEAFAFFRGNPKVQRRLATLKEVGLEYLPLGQPATTLSGGESQRLKIAAFLSGGTARRTLFLFDEPTVGLHAADVARLLECFRRLISIGHSLVVVEHRLDVLRAADWLIELGPEAGEAGGELIAAGPPAIVAATPRSVTGPYLAM
jgi:excinuclease ABC subunit A